MLFLACKPANGPKLVALTSTRDTDGSFEYSLSVGQSAQGIGFGIFMFIFAFMVGRYVT